MRYTYKLILIALVAIFVMRCNLNINEDPNRVTANTVTGELIFPAAAHETGQLNATRGLTFLNNWLGYWAASGTFAIDATETTYNITASFGDVLWQTYYNALFDLNQSQLKSMQAGDTLTAAASMILSTYLFQNVVDIYGDAPYSQAFQFTTYPQPAYDKAQDIYNGLNTSLDQAISFMGPKVKGLSTFAATTDIVNHGDRTLWIKLANTLKLRLLVRQSEISGFDPTADLTKIITNGGVLQAGETISVNPGYTKATNKQSPFYNAYGLTVNDAEAAPAVRANSYFVNILQTNSDPRLNQYFIPLSGTVVGNVYGLAAGNPLASSGIGDGLAHDPAQDQWILTSVESLFLEAEAIERGWLPGSASSKYNEAITESFVWMRVPDAANEAATYLANFPYQAGNLKNTLYQKYLSLCGIAPVESWSDLRRIGFDIIPASSGAYTYITANPSAISQTIPIRLLYAQSEYTTNAESVNKVGSINQFTSKIFWDVN